MRTEIGENGLLAERERERERRERERERRQRRQRRDRKGMEMASDRNKKRSQMKSLYIQLSHGRRTIRDGS